MAPTSPSSDDFARVLSQSAEFTRRGFLIAGLAGLGATVLSACGDAAEEVDTGSGSGGGTQGTVTVAPDGTQQITVLVRDDYEFHPAAFSVSTGRVRLTLASQAEQLTHNFRFTPDGGPAPIVEEIPIVAPGDSDTIEFAVDKTGDYQYECSFHVALGQIGVMTVTAG
ncbi:hypothetical protein E9529_19035 [Blastococcus sp. KM273128]|nr:hypothetical protein [Blastococcus sp. KM273128]